MTKFPILHSHWISNNRHNLFGPIRRFRRSHRRRRGRFRRHRRHRSRLRSRRRRRRGRPGALGSTWPLCDVAGDVDFHGGRRRQRRGRFPLYWLICRSVCHVTTNWKKSKAK